MAAPSSGDRPEQYDRVRTMNTISHISGFIALLWLSLYAFQTLSEPQLGYAILGPALVMFVLTFIAIDEDVTLVQQFRAARRRR